MRGILDNVAMTNTPRIGIVEGQVDVDDVMNNEIGGVIRMRQAGAVQPFSVPFAAGQTLPAMQYLDQMIEGKTGVTRASMGLDPDALQSTTRAAVTATVQAAAGQTEVMARNLAEGGMRQLFKLMLSLIVKHADAPKFMRLNGEFREVDPRVWDTSMDLSVNIGLGTGREEEKAAAYREVLGLQMQVYNQYGPGNGVVSLVNIRNTVADIWRRRACAIANGISSRSRLSMSSSLCSRLSRPPSRPEASRRTVRRRRSCKASRSRRRRGRRLT